MDLIEIGKEEYLKRITKVIEDSGVDEDILEEAKKLARELVEKTNGTISRVRSVAAYLIWLASWRINKPLMQKVAARIVGVSEVSLRSARRSLRHIFNDNYNAMKIRKILLF